MTDNRLVLQPINTETEDAQLTAPLSNSTRILRQAATEATSTGLARCTLLASYHLGDAFDRALPASLRQPDGHVPLRLRLAGSLSASLQLAAPAAGEAARTLATRALCCNPHEVAATAAALLEVVGLA